MLTFTARTPLLNRTFLAQGVAPEAATSERWASGSVASEEKAPTPPPASTPAESDSAPSSSTSSGESPSPPPAAPRIDPAIIQVRQQAQKEVDTADPKKLALARPDWLYFTVPAVPTATVPCRLYYNRGASDVLGGKPRLQVNAGFNEWELSGQSSELFKVDLGAGDWWVVDLAVPGAAYEMNFSMTDCEGTWDNNSGQDFLAEVAGGSTRDAWLETAPDRLLEARMKREAEAARREAEERKQAEAAALQHDKQVADERVGALKHALTHMREGVPASLPGVLTTAAPLVAGSKATVEYNLAGSCLGFLTGHVAEGTALTLKFGFNDWQYSQDVLMERVPARSTAGGEEWWRATVSLPPDALTLNAVVNYYEHWDNNGGGNFTLRVQLPKDAPAPDAWAEGMWEAYRAEEQARREAETRRWEEKLARAAAKREAVRQKAREVTRRQLRHVLFTEPAVVEAGNEVTINYCPVDTPLAMHPTVYVRGGYNHWQHPKPFGPVLMTPPSGSRTHFQASVTVPRDATDMHFVFSDVEEGDGTYDNRQGRDYNLEVAGSVAEAPPLIVTHISVEMAPIAKVGGLADVVTALGRAVQEAGHVVDVILPRYDFFLHSPLLQGALTYECEFYWGGCTIYVSTAVVEGLRCFFIEPNNGMFATSTVYGRDDDESRFDFFCKAALEFLLQSGRQPDILHCHDWVTADTARSYWEDYHHNGLWKPKVVFTIHNLNYGAAKIGSASYYSQRVTTVSPTYALESSGHPSIGPSANKFMGVRNGIDVDIWDPENDQFLPEGYTSATVEEGKSAARNELRSRLGLSGWGDKPIVGVVSRLTAQKGVHLIKHAAWKALDRGAQFVLLGSAPDPKIQAEFEGIAGQLGGSGDAAFAFAFDEPLSHLIYAAADIIAVPSMFEPCGLTQMIAMRYGAIPIVRSTGGLHDTVFDVDYDKPRAAWEMEGSADWEGDGVDATNGFAFQGTGTGDFDSAFNRAMDGYYNDRQWWRGLQARVMMQDWSWNRPALDYIELYWNCKK